MSLSNRFATPEENQRFERFLEWLARRGRRASTARSYTSDWQALTMWYRRSQSQRFTAEALDATLIGQWRTAVEDKGRSPSTVLRRMAFARTYISWLAREGVLEAQTASGVRSQVRLQRAQRGPRLLAPAEVHQLLAHVDSRACHRDQAIVYVLLDSGLRVSELVHLDVGDVDFSQGSLLVRKGRHREVPLPTRAARKLAWSLGERGLLALPEDGEIVLPASGGWPPSGRVTPPDPSQLPALRSVPLSPMPFGFSGKPAEWPLFVGERGRLSVNGVQRVVRKHSAFARVDATPQVLRHTFAFGFWTRHHDLVALAEALGNESIESGRVYAQLAETLAAAPVEAAEARA